MIYYLIRKFKTNRILNLIATSIKKKGPKRKEEKKRNGNNIRPKAYISTKARLGPLLNIFEFGKTNNSNSY